ncbi:MAG: hypothetical protein HXX08_11260 [Chloroflexi bacterium]|uniref:Uncharacterized protein n=1 Tax=Candidatus Chlorohelix allophototropha TaxID=3003348 RepID=A0A8T7LZI8_9CHLR|nr:hypothetical protein [Chloroflexota bacterium]WJW65815.1 hypothetical protein OZ401_001594 [Chloroflexota bacterium L227-S17]
MGRKKHTVVVETERSQQAFEAYWALGASRSQVKLQEKFKADRAKGIAVPTVNIRQISDWSAKYGWQNKIRVRVAEELERERIAARKEKEKDQDQARKIRRGLLNQFIKIFNEAEKNLKPDKISWTTAIEALRLILQESRAEFDDMPTVKVQANEMTKDELINAINERLARLQANSNNQ